MDVDTAVATLKSYLSAKAEETKNVIDREHVVAHATLSAFKHHWPSQWASKQQDWDHLLEQTQEIKTIEHSRWMTQRRIAIAKGVRLRRVESCVDPLL